MIAFGLFLGVIVSVGTGADLTSAWVNFETRGQITYRIESYFLFGDQFVD
jgi:hypothetical protein